MALFRALFPAIDLSNLEQANPSRPTASATSSISLRLPPPPTPPPPPSSVSSPPAVAMAAAPPAAARCTCVGAAQIGLRTRVAAAGPMTNVEPLWTDTMCHS